MTTTDLSPLARQVLAYFAENPEAQDTAKGIAEWWLLGHGSLPPTESLTEALDTLVREHWIASYAGGDQQTRYGLVRNRLETIRVLLRESENKLGR